MRGLRFLATASIITGALAFAPAAGADPFTITTTQDGTDVGVGMAVDDGGTAHVAWTDTEGLTFPDSQVVYCQIDAGGTGCDPNTRRVLPRGATAQADGTTPTMLKDGGHIVVFDSFIDGLLRWDSSDNGDSWSTPLKVWDQDPNTVVGTGGLTTVFGVRGFSHVRVERLEPTFDDTPAEDLSPSNKDVLDPPGMTLTDNGTPMVSYSYENTIYTRTNTDTSQVEHSSAWTPEAMVDAGSTPRLARAFGGGQDIVMVNQLSDNPGGLFFRRADNDVFGSPTQIVTGQVARWNIAGDAGGHLQVVWWNNTSDEKIRYRRMAADGTFSDETTLSGDEEARNLFVASNSSGNGLAVWNTNGAGLRAAHLALPEAPPPPPGPGPTPKGPKLSLGPKKAKLSRKGTITIKVGCPASAAGKCAGTLTVHPHGSKSKVGSAKLSVAAGKSANVPVTLNAATRRKIKKLKKKKTLKLDVIGTAHVGSSADAKATLVIKVGKR
jgi:hypothetical protein